MPSPHATRPVTALLADDEPRDAFAGEQEHPTNKEEPGAVQAPRRKPHGLNKGELQYVQTREKAEALAERIRRHWAEQHGIEADVYLEQFSFGRYSEFAVRSTLKLTASPPEVQR